MRTTAQTKKKLKFVNNFLAYAREQKGRPFTQYEASQTAEAAALFFESKLTSQANTFIVYKNLSDGHPDWVLNAKPFFEEWEAQGA